MLLCNHIHPVVRVLTNGKFFLEVVDIYFILRTGAYFKLYHAYLIRWERGMQRIVAGHM